MFGFRPCWVVSYVRSREQEGERVYSEVKEINKISNTKLQSKHLHQIMQNRKIYQFYTFNPQNYPHQSS